MFLFVLIDSMSGRCVAGGSMTVVFTISLQLLARGGQGDKQFKNVTGQAM